jgi:signal transduction histidine kinase/CheY-like chemotaxis protein
MISLPFNVVLRLERPEALCLATPGVNVAPRRKFPQDGNDSTQEAFLHVLMETSAVRKLAQRLEVAAIVAGLAIMLLGMIQVIMAERRLAEADALSQTAERLESALVGVQNGYRGFAITGGDDDLQLYDDALTSLSGRLEAYVAALVPFDAAAKRADATRDQVSRLLAEASAIIAARRDAGFEGARVRIAGRNAKTLMIGLRDEFDAAQRNSAEVRRRVAWSGLSPATIAIGGGFMLILIGGPLLAYRAYRQRRRSETAGQLFSDVMARAPVGIAIVDVENRIVDANAAFRTLLDIDQGVERFDRLPVQYSAAVRPALDGALSGFRASFKSQPAVPIEMGDGEGSVHLQATLFPVEVPNASGSIRRGAAMLVSDVSRQRAWEAELESARDAAETANRAKSAFLANMSHELRTPLTAVLGYCELLEEEMADAGQDALIDDLKKVELNARHLLGLINDVLDLSKIEAEKLEISQRDIDVRAFVDEVSTSVSGLMVAKDNRFDVRLHPAIGSLHTDDFRLRQILLNLIGNAAKFTERGEIILTVAEEARDRRVAFTVSDTGIGMSDEQLAGLFQRFQQADQSTTRRFGGTGLGLALTKALTELLGGTISVRSRLGEGTSVTVSLPLRAAIERQEAPVASTAPRAPVSDGSGIRILVVDDDSGAREHLFRVLSREGFTVETCADGADVVEKAAEFAPAAVLLDVLMPHMNGWEVLKRLRADARTADIPVIMQTLLDAENVAYALGANGYLRKPFRRSSILHALSGIGTTGAPSAMLIDDDAEARQRIGRMLRRDGWIVHEHADGQAALDALATERPDVVLVDLVMPVMDGHAFIQAVRRDDEWRDLPIVVLTAEDVADVRVEGLSGMTADIIQKGSMPLAELIARLRRHAPAGEPHDRADAVETQGA